MNIEVHKRYKTRDGREMTVTADIGLNPYGESDCGFPIVGYIKGDPFSRSWTREGTYTTYDEPCGRDLIAEWREPVTKEAIVYMYQSGFVSTCNEWKYEGTLIASTRVTLTEGVFAK